MDFRCCSKARQGVVDRDGLGVPSAPGDRDMRKPLKMGKQGILIDLAHLTHPEQTAIYLPCLRHGIPGTGPCAPFTLGTTRGSLIERS